MDLATETKLDQEITCSQCQEVFKQPKILSCMHTFCTKCIEPFIDQCSKKILCTLCSRTTEVRTLFYFTTFLFLLPLIPLYFYFLISTTILIWNYGKIKDFL